MWIINCLFIKSNISHAAGSGALGVDLIDLLASVSLTVVLSDLRLEIQVVPLHISLDKVGNRADYWCQQTYVYTILGNRGNI